MLVPGTSDFSSLAPVSDDILADVILRRPLRQAVDDEQSAALARNGLAARVLPLINDATDSARTTLQVRSRKDQFRAMLVAGATAALQQAVRERGISALFYKGPALGAALGEPVGERPSADVDVLIQWDDLPKVHDLLVERGYALKLRYSRIPTALERRLECERTYIKSGAVSVDVHWWVDTGASFQSDFATLWGARRTVTLAETTVDTLGTEDALLVTAVHGCRELWHSAKWIVDAGRQLNEMSPQQRKRCHRLAAERGCHRALLATEALIGHLGALPQPAATDAAIQAWVASVSAGTADFRLRDSSPTGGRRRSRLRGAVLDSRAAAIHRTSLAVARGVWGRAFPVQQP